MIPPINPSTNMNKLYTIEERRNKKTPFKPIHFFERVKREVAYGGWWMLTSDSCEARGIEYRLTVSNSDGSSKYILWTWPEAIR